MRQELKDINWHIYGLSPQEFEYTLTLVKEFQEARVLQIKEKIKNTHITDQDGNTIPIDSEDAFEALDDIHYYHYIDSITVFQFGLWRLQGIFEGILRQEFFPNQEISGLKKKLDTVRSQGLNISNEDYDELISWARLRNALSHFPPEKFRPIGLDDTDILEYKNLVDRVTEDLIKQKGKQNSMC